MLGSYGFHSTPPDAVYRGVAAPIHYTALFPGITGNYNYWQRLSFLSMYSQERRAERYRAIYTWKTLEGSVPNSGLSWSSSPVSGRLCYIPTSPASASVRVKNLRNSSFQVSGPKIFNSLPESLRSMTGCSADTFKKHLDTYLSSLPDNPSIGSIHQHHATQSQDNILTQSSTGLNICPFRTDTLCK